MVLHNVMLLVVGLLISILLQGSTSALILSKPYTVIVMLVPTVTITLHACVYCYRFVCSNMYMDVILLVILYQLSFLYYFYCTFVLLSQEWLNKDVQSISNINYHLSLDELVMMMSWQGNSFRVTGPLWG